MNINTEEQTNTIAKDLFVEEEAMAEQTDATSAQEADGEAEESLKSELLDKFVETIEELMEQHADWQANEYKTANERLYGLLAQVYDLYMQYKEGSSADQAKREWLQQECEKLNIKLSKRPTFLQLITKRVFFNELVDSKRVSSYVRALSAAEQLGVKTGSEIPGFIRKYGGIEEVRGMLNPNHMTVKQRASKGRETVSELETLTTVSLKGVADYLTDAKGKPVLLVGMVNDQGGVDVKEVCYDGSVDGPLKNNTAVNAALASLYSLEKRKSESKKAMDEAEKQAASKNGVFARTVEDYVAEQTEEEELHHAA